MVDLEKKRCIHFFKCSGCDYEDLKQPPQIFEELKNYLNEKKINPLFIQGSTVHWRSKAKLAVREENGELKIGLFKKNSHEVLSIPHCLVHHPSINKAVLYLEKAIKANSILPYDEKHHKGHLRYVQLQVQKNTGKVQLTLVFNQEPKNLKIFTDDLFKEALFHSIWCNYQPNKTNTIFGLKWTKICGEEYLLQPFLSYSIAYHPAAFCQAHLDLFEKIVLSILKKITPSSKVLEIFAGVGVIGISVSTHAKEVILVENNPFSFISFQKTLEKLPDDLKQKIKYLNEDANSSLDLLKQVDTVIVDPPRKGLSEKLINALSNEEIKYLFYVSCQFSTFQRDCDLLLVNGWKIESVEGYQLFPGTDHIEVLAYFKKSV